MSDSPNARIREGLIERSQRREESSGTARWRELGRIDGFEIKCCEDEMESS